MSPDQQPSRVTVDRPETRSHRSTRWLLPLSVVLVIGAMWSFRGEATPEDDPPDLESIETITTTTVEPLEGDLLSGWVSIDLPGSGEVIELVDTRFGLYAASHNSERTTLWRSSDGLAWEPIPDEEVFLQGEIHAIVETELGLIAVGASNGPAREDFWGQPLDNRNPAVWRSVDGATWERLSDETIERSAATLTEPDDEDAFLGTMNDVVVWEDRLVSVGWSSSGDHQGAAWVSDLDGMQWRMATTGLDGGGTGFTEVEAVVVLDGGLVAVGSVLSRPTVWTSPDAMTWTPADPKVTVGTLRSDRPFQIVTQGPGVVSVGGHRTSFTTDRLPRSGTGYGVVWVSRDGKEWVRLAPEELDGALLEDVVVADPWLIAGGSIVNEANYSTDPAVWASRTGGAWQVVDLRLEGYEWGESSVNAVVRGGPGLIAGGTVQGLPQLWVWSTTGAIGSGQTMAKRPKPGRWVLRAEPDPEFPNWNVRVVFGEYLAFGDDQVWRSKDWVQWESDSFTEVGLARGSWYGEPVVVDGTAYTIDETGRLWSSVDGHQWSLTIDERFDGYAEGPFPGAPGELLVIEHPEYEAQRAHLWRSSGGHGWTEVTLPDTEWISAVHRVGGRYVVLADSMLGPTVWVSTDDGEWEAVDLDGFDGLDGRMIKHDDRLFILAFQETDQSPSTKVVMSEDGLHWEPTKADLPGWPGQLVKIGQAMILVTHQLWGEDQMLWSSHDGEHWTRIGQLPVFQDFWAQVLPSNDDTIRMWLEGESARQSVWEWVPPEGG